MPLLLGTKNGSSPELFRRLQSRDSQMLLLVDVGSLSHVYMGCENTSPVYRLRLAPWLENPEEIRARRRRESMQINSD